ncbi:hypothetical protein HDU97_009578 [Phlyctochytrium planicorne]|nr:hypothetical protein HDU97_009578 [Phlyctochytrium planicorne]
MSGSDPYAASNAASYSQSNTHQHAPRSSSTSSRSQQQQQHQQQQQQSQSSRSSSTNQQNNQPTHSSSPHSTSSPSSGPESLITQVQPPSNNPISSVAPPSRSSHDDEGNYPAGIITSVAPPANGTPATKSAPRTISTQPTQSTPMNTSGPRNSTSNRPPSRGRGGFGSVISRLFCCCGSSQPSSSGSGKVDKGDHELTPTAKAAGGYDGKSGNANKPTIVKSAAAQGPTKRQQEKKWLLKPLASEDHGKKCLVLDLDETLVHSSFKAVPNADFVIPVEIDAQIHNVYVLKRPGVDVFLQRLGRQFEVVVFTASLAKYADPVLDMLDKHRVVKHRLFRESCLHHKGNYVKDLSQLGRDLKDVIILDNSPASYIFHPTNAIPISSWFNDPNDTELLDLIPFLEDLKLVENVMTVLANDASD